MTEPASVQELFRGRHFDQEIIVLCVRWYLTFKLSSRDLVQMMAERGIALAHTTILRWVQRYVPDFEKRWNQYARAVGDSWRVDETYIEVKGQWVYLYRAVDKQPFFLEALINLLSLGRRYDECRWPDRARRNPQRCSWHDPQFALVREQQRQGPRN